MKQLCSMPLISGLCVDKTSRYKVFAAIPTFDNAVNLIGILMPSASEDSIAFTWICHLVNNKLRMSKTGIAIPTSDLAQLLSGVIETKGNG